MLTFPESLILLLGGDLVTHAVFTPNFLVQGAPNKCILPNKLSIAEPKRLKLWEI
jgi:hypothetical protein